MTELGHKDLSGKVIEAAIAVHQALGPGFIESVYERALCVELAARGIKFEMKAAGIRDGLILNFASMPLTIKRIGPGLPSS